MKTAEEWVSIINNSDAPASTEGGGLWQDETSYRIVRAVQLDAFKAGMTEAAKRLSNLPNHYAEYGRNAIRSARDNLKELPAV